MLKEKYLRIVWDEYGNKTILSLNDGQMSDEATLYYDCVET